MKNLRYGHCLLGVAAAVTLLLALGLQASTLGFLAVVLVCPLMMFAMMHILMGDRAAQSRPEDRGVERSQGR